MENQKSDILSKIKNVISTILQINVEEISEDSSQATIASWDSLNQINIIIGLEEEFGISFTDDQTIKMNSIRTILSAVSEQLKALH